MPRNTSRGTWSLALLVVSVGCNGAASRDGRDQTVGQSPARVEQPEVTEDPEATPAPTPRPQVEDPQEAEAEAGDRCLPVARCASFSEPDCVFVAADGTIGLLGELRSWPDRPTTERACPGDPAVHESVATCFDYVEGQHSCRRRPRLRTPPFGCGSTDEHRCAVL